MRRGLALALLGFMGVVAARRWLDVVEVRGRSMSPTLVPGDRLLVVRARPRPGDVVLAPDPRAPARELVKRVGSVGRTGVHLSGDNPAASTDARTFGTVPAASIGWRAIGRYWPLDRVGTIPPAPVMDLVDEGGDPARAAPEGLIAGH